MRSWSVMARGPLSRVIDRGGQPGNSWRFRAFAAIPTRLRPTATDNYVLRARSGRLSCPERLMTKGEIPDLTLVAVCAVCGTIALGFYAVLDRFVQPDSASKAK